MDTAEVAVVIGGLALIGFILWFFFGPRRGVEAASPPGGGVQEISVTVKGGYSPDVIVVRRGAPVRLHFYRDETASCSERLVLSDFGIVRDLPAFQTTTVEFTPTEPGEHTFTCGMNMMRGRIVVR